MESNLSSSSILADSAARLRIDKCDIEVAVGRDGESDSARATGISRLEDNPMRSDLDLRSILATVGLHDGTRLTPPPQPRPRTAHVSAPVLSSAASEDTDTRSVSVDVRALRDSAQCYTFDFLVKVDTTEFWMDFSIQAPRK